MILILVEVLALTTTTTKETLEESVKDYLPIDNPTLLASNQTELTSSLLLNLVQTSENCHQLTDELMAKWITTPKTSLFCQSMQHCANVLVLVSRSWVGTSQNHQELQVTCKHISCISSLQCPTLQWGKYCWRNTTNLTLI